MLKIIQLMSYMNFQMIQALIKILDENSDNVFCFNLYGTD